MKRSAFMGTCAMAYMLRYWCEFLPNWIDEVDEIIISLQNTIPSVQADYIKKIFAKYPKIKLSPEVIPWPDCITRDISLAKTDTVLILHDDTFFLKKGVVDEYFKIAETGKVVTPLHHIYSCGDYVNKTLEEYHGDYMKQFPHHEYSFLLYLLFMPRNFFMRTSGDLKVRGWKQGEFSELFGRVVEKDGVGGDTGFSLGLELFMQKVPFHILPKQAVGQCQFEPDPLVCLKNLEFKEGWVHFQNMANTLPDWFNGNHGWKNIENKTDPVMMSFMTTRLALMQEFLRVDDYAEMKNEAEAVRLEMSDIKRAFNLDNQIIEQYQKEIRRMLCVA